MHFCGFTPQACGTVVQQAAGNSPRPCPVRLWERGSRSRFTERSQPAVGHQKSQSSGRTRLLKGQACGQAAHRPPEVLGMWGREHGVGSMVTVSLLSPFAGEIQTREVTVMEPGRVLDCARSRILKLIRVAKGRDRVFSPPTPGSPRAPGQGASSV